MRHLLTILFLFSSLFSIHGQCDISSISYDMPNCNLEGQTITVTWIATCPDDLVRIVLADDDANQNVQEYTNIANTGSYDFLVANSPLVDANYQFYIEYVSQVDWIYGPGNFQVNDPQISVLEEFYELTDGDLWIDNTGWLADCDPCGVTSGTSWFGLTCNGVGEVIKIDLANNGIIGEYADDTNSSSSNHFCDLSALQHIDLSNNQLTGEIPSCFFSMAKDTLKLNGNGLTGDIPIEIQNADPNMVLDISNNQLTGCFDNFLNSSCDNVNLTNATISDDNSFEGDWEDFCASGEGVCCESEITIDLATVKNGSYYARDQINLSGISNANTDITLASPLVKVDEVLTENVLGSNIEILGIACNDRVGMNFTTSPDHLFNSDFAFSNDFTMTFWFNTSANQTSSEGRIFNMNNSSNRLEIGIEHGSNKFWAYDHIQTRTSDESYNDGVWHHVIVRNEGSVIDFYVDGELVFTSPNGSLSLTGGFHIGRYSFINIAHYQGSLSDLRIYNDALDLSSVLQEYNCNIYENDNLLDLHYTFSNGIPLGDNTAINSIIDESENGNDADIVGMTLTGSESNFVDGNDIGAQDCCGQGFVIVCYSVVVQLDPVTGQVEVAASLFDEDTALNCGDGYTVSYTPDGSTTNMTFDCDDLGLASITIYFISDDGTIVDSCDTFIEVQDNDNICA